MLIAIARPLEEGCTFADYHPAANHCRDGCVGAAVRHAKVDQWSRHAHNGDTRSRI